MNTNAVVRCKPREEYMRKLGGVICPGAKQQPLSEIEKKYQRLGSGAFSVMYGLFILGMFLMWQGMVTVGAITFAFGVFQFYLIVSFNELWFTRHYRYAVEELDKDPEAKRLIAEYSEEDWPANQDFF